MNAPLTRHPLSWLRIPLILIILLTAFPLSALQGAQPVAAAPPASCSVSGSAYSADVTLKVPLLPDVTLAQAGLATLGSNSPVSAAAVNVSAAGTGSVVVAAATNSSTDTSTTALARAESVSAIGQADGQTSINILGLVTADAITTTATSQSDGVTASSTGNVQIVGLQVNGASVNSTAPNTVINLLGGLGGNTVLGTVTINEQQSATSGATSSMTVNALHVRLTAAVVGLAAGTDVIVGSATSSAGCSAPIVPTITALNPSSIAQNSGQTSVAVTGTGFAPGAVVRYGSTAVPTTVNSDTSLTATFPASAFTNAGPLAITVQNLNGSTSAPATLTVTAAPISSPTITSLNPSSVPQGSGQTSVTVSGTDFQSGAVVRIDGTAAPTTFNSATSLTATVPASALGTAGTRQVTVLNPDGGTSAPATLTVSATPTITSLNPSSVPQLSGPTAVTVNGTGFQSGAVVRVDGIPVGTVFNSATSLTATVPASAFLLPGTRQITVVNPDGGTSGPATLTVSLPGVLGILTAVAASGFGCDGGNGTITVTVNDLNLLGGSATVYLNGTPLATVNNGDGTLTATVPANLVNVVGPNLVTVAPVLGGVQTLGVPLAVTLCPLPTITSLNPSSVPQGSGPTSVVVTGTNFAPGAVVQVDGTSQPTTQNGSTQLTVTVPASSFLTTGTRQITVVNPDGGTSSPATLTVTAATSTPTITSLNPSSVPQSSGPTTVVVTGTGFQPGAQVQVDGTAVPTTVDNSGQVTATLPAGSVANPGTLQISVRNPDGGTSGSTPLTVVSAPTITSLNPATVAQLSGATPVVVTGTNFQPGAVVRVDGNAVPTTFNSSGQVTATVPASTFITAGTRQVTVLNPDGGTSAPATLTVTPPGILGILTAVAASGFGCDGNNGTITVTVNDLNLLGLSATVYLNGTALTTVNNNDGTLTATVPANLVNLAGPNLVTVAPILGGVQTPSVPLTVALCPLPTITSLNPSSVPQGSGPTSVVVTGANFAPGAVVQVNGTSQPTTQNGSTQLTVTVPAASFNTPGTLQVTVRNPDGGTSGPAPLAVVSTPTITSLNPSSVPQGSGPTAVVVTGTGFVAGAVVRVDGTAVPTTFNNSGQVTATVPASAFASAGTRQISVRNPDGGTTGTAPLTVTAPVSTPTIIALTPSMVPQGSGPTAVVVTGTNFQPGAEVRVDGTAVPTTFNSSGQVTATFPASTFVTAGTRQVTVRNPDSGVTGPATLTVMSTTVPLQLVTLTINIDGNGSVQRSPAGIQTGPNTFQYPVGTVVQLVVSPAAGSTFTRWFYDGNFIGWPNPVDLTMDANHTMTAQLVATPSFNDVPQGRADYGPITELAARQIIFGYGNGNYGPDDQVQRAQMAALIARSFGWDKVACGNNPFTDQGGINQALWDNVCVLAEYKVAFGYTSADCVAKGKTPPCYGPADQVSYAQTISFITRAMVHEGYWTYQPERPGLYGGVVDGSGHNVDISTFIYYTQAAFGGVPDHPDTGTFPDVHSPASRGWFARALWNALNSYFSIDRVP